MAFLEYLIIKLRRVETLKNIDVSKLGLFWRMKKLERSKLRDDFVDYLSNEKEEFSKPISKGDIFLGG